MNKFIYVITLFFLIFIFALGQVYADQTYNITLKSGENLVVLPAAPKNTDIKVVLSAIISKVKDVWEFNPNDANDPWKHFRPGLDEYSDLKEMSVSKGYWINLKSDVILQITGTAGAQTPEVNLKQGWNEIVWLYESSLGITGALYGLTFGVDYDQVSCFNNTTKVQEDFLCQPGSDTLTKFDSDKVYYIHMLNEKKIELCDPANTVPQDTIAPHGIIKINNDAKYTNSSLVSLDLSAEDNLGGSGIFQMRLSNDNVNWTAPENYSGIKTWVLVSGEGEKWVYVKFSDKINNWSQVYSNTIIVDTTPPVLTINPVLSSTNQDVRLSYAATDNFTPANEICISGDNSPYTQADSYNLNLTAQDRAGNSVTKSISFTIDKTAPIVKITSPVNNSVVSTPQITIEYTVKDGIGESNKSKLINLIPGINAITIEEKDIAGNSGADTISVVLDTSAPQIHIDGVVNDSFVNADVSPVVTISEDNLSSQSIKLNGQDWASGTKITAEGEYALEVSAEDKAGNHASKSISFTIDKTIPEVNFTGVEDGKYYNCAVTPVVNVSDTNLIQQAITLNSQTFNSATEIIEEGSYLLEITAEDKAGNKLNKTLNFVIDKTAPLIEISGVVNGNFYNQAVILIIKVNDDNLLKQAITLNNQLFISGSTISAEGEYSLCVEAEDKVGNKANESIKFAIDKTLPVVTIVSVNSPTNVSNQIISGAYVEENIQCIEVNGITAIINPQEKTYSVELTLNEGVNDIKAAAKDLAGNSGLGSTVIILDQTAPVVKIISPVNNSIVNTPQISVEYSLDDADGESNKSKLINLIPGVNTITIEEKDLAGNPGVDTITVILDTATPQIHIDGVVNDSFVNTDVTPVITIFDDNLAVQTIKLNGQPFTSGTPITVDGEYILEVSAEDRAANTASQTIKFTIDKAIPFIDIKGMEEGKYYNCHVFPLIDVTDTNLDSQIITLNTNPFISGTPITNEGEYIIEVTAIDKAGNTTTKTVNFSIDTTPPILTINPVLSPTKENVTLSYTAIDNFTPAEKIVISGDNSPYVNEGNYNVTLTAMDLAGNSADFLIDFTIDKTAPVVVITSPQNGAVVEDSDIQLQGTVDGVDFSELRTLTSGENTLTKTATDSAGNTFSVSVIVYLYVGEPIGIEGGEVTSSDGKVKVIIPAGALTNPATISIAKVNKDTLQDAVPIGRSLLSIVECKPYGLVFNKPVELIYSLEQAEIPGTPVELGFFDAVQDKIIPTGQTTTVPVDGYTVKFSLMHFSTYACLDYVSKQGAPIGAGVQIPLPDLLTGSFSHAIPITVPPGRKGMQPQIGLSYRSSNPNSWVGLGFSLNSGYIVRSTRLGPPSYDDKQDTFYFITEAGTTELVHLIDNLYQAKVESGFTKFFKEPDDSWKVVTKDGAILRFGQTTDSKETSTSGTFSWYITKAADANGNYIEYCYTKDQGKAYLSRIDYTGNETGISPTNSVEFNLEPREDIGSSCISTSMIATAKRLKEIEAKVKGELVWRYELKYDYSQDTNRSLLKSITQSGSSGKSLPTQNLTYQQSK